jgi:hypothetical protein
VVAKGEGETFQDSTFFSNGKNDEESARGLHLLYCAFESPSADVTKFNHFNCLLPLEYKQWILPLLPEDFKMGSVFVDKVIILFFFRSLFFRAPI